MEEKKQKVFNWLMELANELDYLAASPLQAKYKIMLLMVYFDIFSQIWDMLQLKKAKNQEQRFINWTDRYFFASTSEIEISDINVLKPLDSSKLYKIRNSLLHFGGLPSFETPVFISEHSKEAFYEKYRTEIESYYEKNAGADRSKGILILYPTMLYRKAIGSFIKTLHDIMTLFPEGSTGEANMLIVLYEKLMLNHALPIRPM